MNQKIKSVHCSLLFSALNRCRDGNARLNFLPVSTYRKCSICGFKHPIKDLIEVEPGLTGPRYVCNECVLNNNTIIRSANGLPSIRVELIVNAANGVNSPSVECFVARGSSACNVLRGDNKRPSRLKYEKTAASKRGRRVKVLGAKKNAPSPIGSDASKRLLFDLFQPKKTIFDS